MANPERIQVIVEAKDAFSGVFRGLTGQLGAVGSVIQELTAKNINWGNVTQWAVTAVVDGLKKAIDTTVQYASEVRQLSSISGMGAEESSRFIQVLDDFKLTTSDALVATRALTANGLAPSLQTVAELSDKYLQLNTVEEKNAFILKNLGRAGVEWVELLSQGKDAILARSAAVQQGLIMDDEMLRKTREYEFQLDDLSDSITALKLAVGEKAIPIVIDLITRFTTSWNNPQKSENEDIISREARNLRVSMGLASGELTKIGTTLVWDKWGPAIQETAVYTDKWTEALAAARIEAGKLATFSGQQVFSKAAMAQEGYIKSLALNIYKAREAEMARAEAMTVSGKAEAESLGITIRTIDAQNTQIDNQLAFNDGTRAGNAALEAYNETYQEVVATGGEEEAQAKATAAALKTYNQVLGDTEKAWKAVVAAAIAGSLGQALKDAQPEIDQYTRNIEYYQSLLKQGPGIIDVYANKVDEMAAAYGENSEQYEAAKKQLENVTTDYQNAGGAIDYYKGKLQEQNDAIDKTISKMIYQQAIGILGADQQLELGRSLGLISEQDYALAASVQTLTEQYDQNGDGAVDNATKAEEYRLKVQDVNDAVQWAIDHNKPVTQEFIFKWVQDEQDKRNAEEKAKRQFQQNAQQLGSVNYQATITPTIDETAQTESKTKLQQLTDTVQAIGDPQTIKIDTRDAIEAAKGLGIQIDTATAKRTLYVDIVVLGNIPSLGGGSGGGSGSGYATGTEYASGLFMAGEGGGGAEYIYAPGGATVFNPKQTRAMQSEMERMRPTEQHNYLYGPATLVITNEESVESLLSVR